MRVELVPPHPASLKLGLYHFLCRSLAGRPLHWARREIEAEVGFGQIAELLVDVEGGSLRSQLSTVAIDIASVLKERGDKNRHNWHFARF